MYNVIQYKLIVTPVKNGDKTFFFFPFYRTPTILFIVYFLNFESIGRSAFFNLYLIQLSITRILKFPPCRLEL